MSLPKMIEKVKEKGQIIAFAFFVDVDLSNLAHLIEAYGQYQKKYDDVPDFNGFLVKILSQYFGGKFDAALEDGITFRAEGQKQFSTLKVKSVQRFATITGPGEGVTFKPKR